MIPHDKLGLFPGKLLYARIFFLSKQSHNIVPNYPSQKYQLIEDQGIGTFCGWLDWTHHEFLLKKHPDGSACTSCQSSSSRKHRRPNIQVALFYELWYFRPYMPPPTAYWKIIMLFKYVYLNVRLDICFWEYKHHWAWEERDCTSSDNLYSNRTWKWCGFKLFSLFNSV